MKKQSLVFILIGIFLICFAYGLFLSLPLFIKHLGGNEKSTRYILGLFGAGTLSGILASKYLLKKYSGEAVAVTSSIIYAAGSMGFVLIHSFGWVLLFSSILVGFGWGLYFIAIPYIISLLTNANNRSVFFSYASAIGVLGTGIAPVLIKLIAGNNLSFPAIFLISTVASLLSAQCFYFIKSEKTAKNDSGNTLNSALLEIRNTEAKYPVVMIFLCGCIFTMLLNFQTTYANSIGMNYAYFYAAYSVSVVLARFLSGKYLLKIQQAKLTFSLASLMLISLILFSLSPLNLYVYILSAVLFGVGYGLFYPTILAVSVNATSEKFRSDVISYFFLSFFVGSYAFPPLGGLIVVHFGYACLNFCLIVLALIVLAFSQALLKKGGMLTAAMN